MNPRFLILVSFAHTFIVSTIICYLICARHYSTCWRHNNEQIIKEFNSLNLEDKRIVNK